MLKNKKGKIINITSVVGHTGNIGQSNYAASKAGIIAMSKTLALEYGKKNIKVNCVSPGFITSDMTNEISEDYKAILKSRISLNKFGEPKDVLNMISFQRRENRKNTRGRRPSGTSRARRSRSNAAMKALTSTLAACCRTTCERIDERSRGPRFEIKRDHKRPA